MDNFSNLFILKLKNKDVPIDGFSMKVLIALEREGINFTQFEELAKDRLFETIGKILYFMCKLSSQTDEFRTINFDDFIDELDASRLTEYFNVINQIAEKSFVKDIKTTTTSKKKSN